jgi:hypothetical protein
MPGEGHASPYLAEFAPHERQGRVEPELGPSTAPGTAYATFSLRCRTVGRGARDRHGAAAVWIDFLKNEKEQRKVRGDDPETTLFMGLRDVYVSLSGKTGISDDGPLHRFANACTKLIDVSIILPQPQSLRKALKRRATPPPYFR